MQPRVADVMQAICVLVVLTIAHSVAFGQVQVGARLFGTVTDPSGSSVQGAVVTITSTTTGAKITVNTGAEGSYVAPQVLPGTYDIEVGSPGFKTATLEGVLVRTNENVRRDFSLALGETSTKINVSATQALTNTYTAQLSQTIDERRIQDLPLNGRDITQMTLLVAGATAGDSGTAWYTGQTGFQTTYTSVNGNHGASNIYLLDGFLNMFMQNRVSNVYPNPDAVEEFTLHTGQYSAEMGGLPGGQMSVVTKSGTNNLHGSLFEFVRNGALNARNEFDRSGQNDGLKRNQWGWAVGGPVYIPKVFNGRNRLFWFNSYQNTPIRRPGSPGFYQSWTRKQKNGDFSESLTGQTQQVASPLCDGSLITADTGAIFDPSTSNSTCGAKGFPFEGNQIPAARLDPVMQNFVNQHTPDSPSVGYQIPHFLPSIHDEWQLLSKGDLILGKHAVMGRYMRAHAGGPSQNDPTGKDLLWNLGPNNGGQTVQAIIWAVSDTWTIAPNLLLTGGFSFVENPVHVNPTPFKLSWSDLGSRITNDPGCKDLSFYVTSIINVSTYDTCQNVVNRTWEINNGVKWVKGSHELSIGGTVSRQDYDFSNQKQGGGAFTFGSQFTGNGAADAILGLAQQYRVDNISKPVGAGSGQQSMAGVYVQDNYRVTRRLTLNLGLRWVPGFSARNKLNQMAWIVPGAQSQVFKNAPPGVLYAGDPGTPGASVFTRWSQWAPRLGFAFDPTGTGKWAVRGGVGSYFGQININGWGQNASGDTFSPVATYQDVINPPNLTWPWDAPPFNGKAGIPLPPPTADSPIVVPIGAGGKSALWNSKNPNIWNWSLTVERRMTDSLLFRGGYVGNRGTHLTDGEYFNLAVYIPGASTIQNLQQRRPDPNYTGINLISGKGDSYYHALQLTAEQRASHGFTFLMNYTFSKSIDTRSNDSAIPGIGTQDPRAPAFNRGLSDFDRTHVVSTSVVWDMPKLSKAAPLVRHVLGNWQLSSIVQLWSGTPFNPVSSAGNDLAGACCGLDNADLVPGANWKVSGRDRTQKINVGYFNQAAFTTNALGTFGNVGRNVIRGPGYAGTDFMLGKVIPIREKVRLQFRSEFFNAFNRVNLSMGNFGGSYDVANSSTFGKIYSAGDPRILQFGLKLLF